mgnify:CR=1 FL=1
MGGNVRISSGTVDTILSAAIATGAGSAIYKTSPKTTFQATVVGTGAVTANVTIEVSNDGINWCSTVLGTIILSGTTTSSDGFTTDAPWKYVRANVIAISGTGAAVTVLMGA